MRNFSKRLKELREEQELTLNQLSKKVGISRPTLYRLEKAQTDIKGEQILILSDFYKVSAGYILGSED